MKFDGHVDKIISEIVGMSILRRTLTEEINALIRMMGILYDSSSPHARERREPEPGRKGIPTKF